MDKIRIFLNKHNVIETILYGIFSIPSIFYAVLGLNIYRVSDGIQKESALGLIMIYLSPINNSQVYFLGALGFFSILLSFFVDQLRKAEKGLLDQNLPPNPNIIILNFTSLTVQYFLVFTFLKTDFLIDSLEKIQSLVLLGTVGYFLLNLKNKRKTRQ